MLLDSTTDEVQHQGANVKVTRPSAVPVGLHGEAAASRSANTRLEVKHVLHVEGSDGHVGGRWEGHAGRWRGEELYIHTLFTKLFGHYADFHINIKL